MGWEQKGAEVETIEFTDIPRNLLWVTTKEVTHVTTQIQNFTY